MPSRLSLRVAAVVVVQVLVVAFMPSAAREVREVTPAGDRPNILFVITDDLDAQSVGRMPKLERWMMDGGTTFDRAFATSTACCPSRASFLTGKYVHNHTVYTNSPNKDGAAPKFRSSGGDRSTIATWLDDRGYETVLIGKYLNYYDGSYVPPGWDEWRGQMGRNNDHEYNINGAVEGFDPDTYNDTELFGDWAADFIRGGAGEEAPFFMYLSVNAPHGPYDGVPRHDDAFADTELPRTPSFDEEAVDDKPGWVRKKPPLDGSDVERLTQQHRERLRSLLTVDDMLARLLTQLRETGELEDTYVVFTSDHGYHLGQHRLSAGKSTAYEEDISIPLIVRGPGVPEGRTLDHMVLNTDFAPAFAELGGAPAPTDTDGRSFVPLLDDSPPPVDGWRESFLVEYFQKHPYAALRTERYSYVEYDNGERELYDLRDDPYQLESLDASPEHRDLTKDLHTRLEALKACSGQASCEAAENAAP